MPSEKGLLRKSKLNLNLNRAVQHRQRILPALVCDALPVTVGRDVAEWLSCERIRSEAPLWVLSGTRQIPSCY